MKKNKNYIFLVMILVCCFDTEAQITYSKMYDFALGQGNFMRTSAIYDNEIKVLMSHYCDSTQNTCTSISTFDFLGNLKDKEIIYDYRPANENGLIIDSKTIYVSGECENEGLETVSLIELSIESETYRVKNYLSNDGSSYWNEGLLKDEELNITYGQSDTNDNTKPSSSLIFWDDGFNNIEKIINYQDQNAENHLDDLQVLPNGNLVYINGAVDSTNSLPIFTTINELDRIGNRLYQFSFEDRDFLQHPNLICLNDSMCVFNSFKKLDGFSALHGLMHCLNKNQDSIVWTFIPPLGELALNRKFRFIDLEKTAKGDVLACGQFSQFINDDVTYSGFIMKVSCAGELVWFKILEVPNYLNPEEDGPLRWSLLRHIKELEDGTILFMGYANYFEDEIIQDFWIVRTDKDGCIDGYECNETTLLTSQNNLIHEGYQKVKIFPNPSNGILNIDFNRGLNLENYVLIDATSSLISKGQVNVQLDFSTLDAGLYYLILFDDDGKYTVKKWIKM